MIAIHDNRSEALFQYRWIEYCKKNNIPFKLVDCYANDIIGQLRGCSALMWHYHQSNFRDIVMAKPLLFALEHTGMKVFPDFKTAWHFDDKVGQKYLLEAIDARLASAWVFYSKSAAEEWIGETTFPKVFKLRGGAGSQNVQLVKSREEALRLTKIAFGRGFSAYDAWGSVKERYRRYRIGKSDMKDVAKGLVRLIIPPRYAATMGRERDYVYFQDFIPNNASDTRIIVINGKAFALKRFVRKNDFRASGSGLFGYAREEFDERCVQMSFDYTRRLDAQCVAYDYVFNENNEPLLVEISYGFANKVYDPCSGYWDEEMNWHEGNINPYGWMVEMML